MLPTRTLREGTVCWPNTGSARSPESQGGQARHLPSGTGVTHRGIENLRRLESGRNRGHRLRSRPRRPRHRAAQPTQRRSRWQAARSSAGFHLTGPLVGVTAPQPTCNRCDRPRRRLESHAPDRPPARRIHAQRLPARPRGHRRDRRVTTPAALPAAVVARRSRRCGVPPSATTDLRPAHPGPPALGSLLDASQK